MSASSSIEHSAADGIPPTLGASGAGGTSREDAQHVYDEWHARTVAHDIEGLVALYLPGAVLESPLVPRVLDVPHGVLHGHDELRAFFLRGTAGRPQRLARLYRTGDFLFDSGRLIWEYPRQTPHGDQLDLVEVMDLQGRRIRHHRIHWGWVGVPLLTRSPGEARDPAAPGAGRPHP